MSVATERRSSGTSSYLAGSLPQVNLLPPEVRASRALVQIKRWLAASIVLVLVLAGLGYVAASLVRQAAADQQAETQAETVRLQSEEAKYAEVPLVVNNLKRADDARILGMSTDVLWRNYLDAVAAVLPPNVAIASFAIVQGSPSIAAPTPADPLSAAGIATVTFTGNAVTVPDNAAWLTALDSIPGFYGATFSTAALGDSDGTVSYAVTSSVQVDLSAFSKRFAATKGK